jgi:formylglycine-generating enzyme required for sulfatase activity
MLTICPNPQCNQKVVLVEGYGQLPLACPRCATDLRPAIAAAQAVSPPALLAGKRALSLDGAEMVYVPAGPFTMGSDLQEIQTAFASAIQKYMDITWVWFERELPKHQGDLPGFWIDVVPVTCAQYQRFCEATGHRTPEYWTGGKIPEGRESHPVVHVSWEDDVLAYCSWVGKRPPYESEWEKAARGTDGRIWPWGNDYREAGGNIDRGLGAGTQPVGSFPEGASPYGCLDMAGNVFEWTRDLCVQYPGFQETDELSKVRQQRMGQQRSERIVVFRDGVRVAESRAFQFFRGVGRGGAWASCAEYCRAAFRCEVESSGTSSLGFRCVLGEDPCDQSRDLGRAGRHAEAVAAAERSLALSPNYPTALFNAGGALEGLGRYQEAAAMFRHLVTVMPVDWDAWNRLGLCHSRLDNRGAAIDSYDAAIDIDPFNADFWFNKGLELGHLVKAVLSPHTIAAQEHRVVVDLPNVPVKVVQAVAELNAEAAGCYHRAQRLGAKDKDVVDGHERARHQCQQMLDHLRGRLPEHESFRAAARIDFCESFPTIQHVWAIVRKYHADADFTYDPLRRHGLGEMEASTGLTYLKDWGRIEVVALKTFRVIHTDDISAYDPCREYV